MEFLFFLIIAALAGVLGAIGDFFGGVFGDVGSLLATLTA